MPARLTGAAQARDALTAAVARVEHATSGALETGLALIEGHARANLSRYSHQIGEPTDSPPGQPPALVGGHLRSSFRTEHLGPYRTRLGPTAVYARIQELGGWAGRNHASYLPPRPYFTPAFDAVVHSGLMFDTFVRAWSGALEG